MIRLIALFVILLFVPGAQAQAPGFSSIQNAVDEGKWAEADQLARAADAAAGHGDFYRAYVVARSLTASGQCVAALPIYDALLNVSPFFLPAVEQAYLCDVSAGDTAAAIDRLDVLLSILPEGTQRESVLRVRQGLVPSVEWSGYIDVAPSTNANRQTGEERLGPLTIAPEARGQAGILISGGLTSTVPIARNPDMSLVAVGRLEWDYDTARELFAHSLTAELPFTFGTLGGAVVGIAPYATVGFEDGEYARFRYGIRGTLSQNVLPTVGMYASGAIYANQYRFLPHRNGIAATVNAGMTWSASPSTLIHASGAAKHDATDDQDYATTEVSARIGMDHAFDEGLILGLKGELGWRWHNRPPPLSSGANQTDWFGLVRVEGSHRDFTIGPFMPTAYYQFSTQTSDNAFYTYESHDIGVRLRAKF